MIGAGTIGCYVASRLQEWGFRVVVLESGSRKTVDGATFEPLPRMVLDGYEGATKGRSFGLGGTSASWGGVLVPFTAQDASAPSARNGATWDHIVGRVKAHGETVRRVLGINYPEDFEKFPDVIFGESRTRVEAEGFSLIASEMLPFGGRNTSRLLAAGGARESRVLLNATAVEWDLRPSPGEGFVCSVRAVTRDGKSMVVTAGKFIIAAGAIESARILLEIDRETDGRALLGREGVGRELSDHLSLPIGTFEGRAAQVAIRMFGQRFRGPVLRAPRFIDRDVIAAGRRHFVHVTFASDDPGFLLAKEVLAAMQARRLPSLTVTQCVEGARGLLGLAWKKVGERRLYIRPGTPAGLRLDFEQSPDPANRIRLRDERDSTGRWGLDVEWRVTPSDETAAAEIQRSVLGKWGELRDVLPPATSIDRGHIRERLYDVYHPVGVCRMGEDPGAVLGLDLHVRGLTNLYVVGTAAFPSAGTANPTFPALCLAEELISTMRTGASPSGR
ncbi:MAG: GMC oxidoreductase [Anaeromyxobacteraceae bacterium]